MPKLGHIFWHVLWSLRVKVISIYIPQAYINKPPLILHTATVQSLAQTPCCRREIMDEQPETRSAAYLIVYVNYKTPTPSASGASFVVKSQYLQNQMHEPQT